MRFRSRSTRNCLPGSQDDWHLTQGQVHAPSTRWASRGQGSWAQPTPATSPLQLQPAQNGRGALGELDLLVSPGPAVLSLGYTLKSSGKLLKTPMSRPHSQTTQISSSKMGPGCWYFSSSLFTLLNPCLGPSGSVHLSRKLEKGREDFQQL